MMNHVRVFQMLRPSLILALGFSLILTFNGPAINLLLPDSFGELSSSPANLSFRLAQVVGFISIAAISNKIETLHSRMAFVSTSALAAFTCALGVSFITLLNPEPYMQRTICVVLLAIIGATSAILYLAWIELICRKSMPHTLACFATAYLLSNLFALILTATPTMATIVISSLLPALMLPLYLFVNQQGSVDNLYVGETPLPGWSFPYRPVILMTIIALANSLIKAFSSEGTAEFSALGALAATTIILVIVVIKRADFDSRILLQASLPIITAASLCLILGYPQLQLVSSFLSNAAFVTFIIFISVTLCGLAYRFGINPLWLFGIVFAARTIASSISVFLPSILDSFGNIQTFQPFVLALIVFVLSAIFPFSIGTRALTGSWGLHLQTNSNTTESIEPFEDLVMSCMLVARKYSLTHREEEILFYLAQDFPLSRIGEKLHLATATVKTHTQHIYKKLGVHSKQEIVELLAK